MIIEPLDCYLRLGLFTANIVAIMFALLVLDTHSQ